MVTVEDNKHSMDGSYAIPNRPEDFDVTAEVKAAGSHFSDQMNRGEDPAVIRRHHGEDGCFMALGQISRRHEPEMSPEDRPDPAFLAQAMLKKAKFRFLLKFWLGWFVALGILAGCVAGAWAMLPDYVTKGRYTVPTDCKVSFGKGELTGTRNTSYAYKSLFGYHLVDESSGLERTVINVTGDKFSVVGIKADGSWWRKDARDGERGILILGDADKYWIQSDKATAIVSHDGFCR